MRGSRILLIALLVLNGSRDASAAVAGAEPFAFLSIDANARAAAMGGAYTSLAGDANALHYNPAGLGRIEGYHLTFMHNRLFQDISQEYVGFASHQGWGLNLNYLTFGKIPRSTLSRPDGTGLGSASLTDLALSVGYGRMVHELLSVGGSFKFIRENIDQSAGMARALDLGALYEISNIPDLKFGIAIQNIGPTVRYDDTNENLPLKIRLGASFDFDWADRTHTTALDVTKVRSDGVQIAFGAEFHPVPRAPVRLGFNTRNDAGPGVTAGVGWKADYFLFDYSFSPFGDLGIAHQFSVTTRWGGHARLAFSGEKRRPVKARAMQQTADSSLERAAEYVELDLLSEAGKEIETVDALLHADDARRVRYHELLGRIAHKGNDLQRAKQHFTRSLQLAIQLTLRGAAVADAHYGMGRCLVQEENFEYAEKFFRKALRAGPSIKTRSEIKRELREIHDRERP